MPDNGQSNHVPLLRNGSSQKPQPPPAEMYPWIQKFRIENSCVREFMSEFIATFVFIVMGEMSMAHFLLKKHHDLFAVVFCWAIAVMIGILTGAGISGGHINPIVTTGLATIGKFPWKKVPHYILAQHLGSFVACALVYVNNKPLMDNFDGGIREFAAGNASGILWTTIPDPVVPDSICVLDTIICSGLLMFGILVVLDKNNADIPAYLHSFYIALLVIAICWGAGSNCMAGINPARDFPPRAFAALIGYKDAFSYRNFWWIPMFVTHVGSSVGCYLYMLTIGVQTPKKMAPLAEIRELKEYVIENKA